MNILEHYIQEIHSEETYTEDWTKKYPDKEYLQVEVTVDCYGSVERKKRIFEKKIWETNKEKGYWLE